jgi:hypothetical protein
VRLHIQSVDRSEGRISGGQVENASAPAELTGDNPCSGTKKPTSNERDAGSFALRWQTSSMLFDLELALVVKQPIGTPEFASPKQFAGVGVDIHSDLYSLVVTLWEKRWTKLPLSRFAESGSVGAQLVSVFVNEGSHPLSSIPHNMARELPSMGRQSLCRQLGQLFPLLCYLVTLAGASPSKHQIGTSHFVS